MNRMDTVISRWVKDAGSFLLITNQTLLIAPGVYRGARRVVFLGCHQPADPPALELFRLSFGGISVVMRLFF